MSSENIFSLDIQDDLVTGVLLKSRSQVSVVSGCYATLMEDRPLEEVVEEVLEKTGFSGETSRVSFGASTFYYRNIQLPFSDKAKIDKILPFELEEAAPIDIHGLVIDGLVSPADKGESEVIAAMLDREVLAERLALLQSFGVDPVTIGVSGVQSAARQGELLDAEQDFLLVNIGVQRATIIICRQGRFSLIRSADFNVGNIAGFQFSENLKLLSFQNPKLLPKIFGELSSTIKITCFLSSPISPTPPVFLSGPVGLSEEARQYLGEYLLGEVAPCNFLDLPQLTLEPEVKINWLPGIMDDALANGLRPQKTNKGFNFRKGEFARKVSIREYRHLIAKAAIPVTILMVVLVGFLGYDTAQKKKERTQLEREIRKIFSTTLPEVTRIVDPVQQLQTRIQEEKSRALGEKGGAGQYRILEVLAEISGRIPESYKVKVVRLVVEKNDLRVKGVTDNFNTVDNVKKVLEKSSFFKTVTISSANLAPRGGEIRFELKLQLNGAQG